MKFTARTVLFVALSLLFALNVIWAGLRIQTQSQTCKDTRFAVAHGDGLNLDGSHYMCHKWPAYGGVLPGDYSFEHDSVIDLSTLVAGLDTEQNCQTWFGADNIVTTKQRTEGVHFFLTQDTLEKIPDQTGDAANGPATTAGPQCMLRCDGGDIKIDTAEYVDAWNNGGTSVDVNYALPSSYKISDSKSTMITVTSLLTNIGVIVSSGVFFIICVAISMFPPNKNALGWWLTVHFVVDLAVIALACLTVLSWNGDRFDPVDEHCRLPSGYIADLKSSMSIGQAPAILSLSYIMIRVAFYLIVYTPAFISYDSPLIENEKGVAFSARSRQGDEEEYMRLREQPAPRGMTAPFQRRY